MSLLMQRLLGAAVLLLCAALGLWLILQQQHRDSAEARRTQQQKRLFEIASPEAVTHITLETPADGVFELVRDGVGDEAWHLVAPQAVLAEASTVEAMLQSAVKLEQTQSVSPTHTTGEGAMDLSIFGLSPPHFRLALTTGDAVHASARAQVLAIGKRNSFDGSLFVQREKAPNIAMVSGEFLSVVDRNLYKLRDKRVLRLVGAKIKRLVVSASSFGPGYSLERTADGFVLQKPLVAEADTQEVEAILSVLTSLRGKSVVAESAIQSQLSLFGLHSPRFTVSLWLGDKDATPKTAPDVELHLGEIQMRGVTHTFVRTNDPQGPIWELGSDWIMQKLRQDAQTLRDMHVLRVAEDSVAQVAVRQNNQTQSFVRKRCPSGSWQPWQLMQDATKVIHPSLVMALVTRVVHLKADRIVAEQLPVKQLKATGLNRPRIEVDLLDEGAHLLGSLLVGAADKDGVFVTTDRKQRLDHITKHAYDDIAPSPDTYLDNGAAP